MRLPVIAVALIACLAGAFPAIGATFRTPEALLKALYRYDTSRSDPDAPSLYSDFLSDRLNARFEKDLEETPEGEVGAIDFDPVIAGQDGEAHDLDIGQPIVIDDTAEVEVSFTNGEPVTLFYSLVKEHGGWKVDDIANQQGDAPWSLSALFDAAGR